MLNIFGKTEDQEYVSLPEGAALLNISPSGLSHLLKKRDGFKEKYMFKARHKGRYRTVITKEGLLVLGLSKDSFRGNTENGEVTSIIPQKEATTERMIDYMKDPVIANRIEHLKLERRVEALEKDLLPMENDAMTPSQRNNLSERIRALVYQQYGGDPDGSHFAGAWRYLHAQVGKNNINDYKREDYRVAKDFLKERYAQADLNW
jgi:hypothetical protein